MGFFDEMLAGGLAGAGKGMSDIGTLNEQERTRKEMQQAQLEQQMALMGIKSADARYKVDENGDLRRELADMKTGGRGTGSGSSRGGSGGGSFFDNMLQNAQTPEEIDKTIRYAQLRMGPDAAAATAEYFGRPLQESVTSQAPTTGDVARYDRGQTDSVPEAVTTQRNKSYDRDKGAQDLNRLIAMADAGKYDDYTKGERNTKLLTNADAVAAGKMTRDSAEATQSLTNPTADPNKVDASLDIADTRAAAKKGSGSGASGAPKLRSTKVDANGQVIGYMSDGSTRVLSESSLDFNKTVSGVVTAKSKDDPRFAKLPMDEKRAQAIAQLGAKPPPAPAPADRMGQFKVIR